MTDTVQDAAPESEPAPRSRAEAGRLAAGGTIIFLGILLLLDRAGIISWADRAGWWSMVAIAFGVIRIAAGGGLRSGVGFVLVGCWGLLNDLGVLHYDTSWPLLLVIFGLSMVIGSLRPATAPVDVAALNNAAGDAWSSRRFRREHRGGGVMPLIWIMIVVGVVTSMPGVRRSRSDNVRSDSDNVIERSVVMAHSRTVSYATQLQGGRVTAVMGSLEVDLTHAAVAPGEEAVLNITTVMGDVRVRVPDNWVVDIQTVPALGEVRDQRFVGGNPAASSDSSTPASRLVLRGFVMMGQVTVRN